MIIALMRTGQVRIFWTHLRTDNELDQVTVDHFRNSDYVGGIKPKPMAPSDVYVGYFGGRPDLGHQFILLSLPRECASEKYILHFDSVLLPEGYIWAAGPVQFGGTLKRFEIYALIQSFLAVRLSLTQPPAAKSASFWTAAVANWLTGSAESKGEAAK